MYTPINSIIMTCPTKYYLSTYPFRIMYMNLTDNYVFLSIMDTSLR